MILLHKANCSTSRDALQYLKSKKCKFDIRHYLDEPLDAKELKDLIKILGCKAEDLLRKKEKLYTELYAGKKLTENQIIKAIAKHPILMQRPIVIDGDKAVIGRPAVTILDILSK